MRIDKCGKSSNNSSKEELFFVSLLFVTCAQWEGSVMLAAAPEKQVFSGTV